MGPCRSEWGAVPFFSSCRRFRVGMVIVEQIASHGNALSLTFRTRRVTNERKNTRTRLKTSPLDNDVSSRLGMFTKSFLRLAKPQAECDMKRIYLACLVFSTPPTGFAQESAITFETHVRPILKAQCFECHGEGKKLRGGLDLRLQHLIKKGGDTGAAYVPNQPTKSPLIERVRSGEMPPGKKKLTKEEIATLDAGSPRAERRSETSQRSCRWAFRFRLLKHPTGPSSRSVASSRRW